MHHFRETTEQPKISMCQLRETVEWISKHGAFLYEEMQILVIFIEGNIIDIKILTLDSTPLFKRGVESKGIFEKY